MDPYGFVLLSDYVPHVIQEIRYFSTYNFIGERIDGYEEPCALITKEAARALKAVSNELFVQGYRLKIFDTYRPACVPTWVTNAKAADMIDADLDAFTGATPKESGKQTFVWDFTDSEGKKVGKGSYKVCVEATLKNEYKLLYVGTLSTKDKAGAIELKETVTGYDEAYAGMIKDVKAIIRK